ncbi:MAG: Fe-S protein [Gammaproteobacteria bacterium]|nr:Fe-S protein [Gammaproteobacteria bacterium]
MIFFSNDDRPFHWGTYPLERLPRDGSIALREATGAPVARLRGKTAASLFSKAVRKYHALFSQSAEGEPAPARAPVPDDLARRTQDIKGAAYFLDAGQVGICHLDDACRAAGADRNDHSHAIVILVEHPRLPEEDSLAHGWLKGSQADTAAMRAFEIAVCIAGQMRQMGFQACAFDSSTPSLDLDRLVLLGGLGVRGDGEILNPYLGKKFEIAAVTTDYALAVDEPLAPAALDAKGLAYWLGIGGATSGLERRRQARRPSHLSRYPMEQVKRVDRPTTLIFEDEVPRVPKRAAFFERALKGDMGEKARKERWRFAYKHPLPAAMIALIRAMVPLQNGSVAASPAAECGDAERNTHTVKSLSYFMGADLSGICEIPEYAWFSHKEDGTPIEPYHRYAVVMLIDQGYETMEGASGDDFISGAQSMRAYLRGAEIAGVMAEFMRSLGFPARPQTNADSDLLHIPLILWAGLGELSRIGELVLNPFVGPRFKSVVLTTDMPLVPDRPIDFGLQYFCSHCQKCARECPCDAIPFGGKVMFNGYEIWKPDVDRCTRYRLTNKRGLACGRCMKTCPLNKVVTWDGPWLTQIASWFGINAMWLKPLLVPIATRLDDWLGHGVRNPHKKWWLDLEIIDGVCVAAPHGANERDLDIHRSVDPAKRSLAYYHANMMPPPDAGDTVYPVDRKAGLAAAALVETPDQARARKARGDAVPVHYYPTQSLALRRDA